jgi:hypothetical protein
MTWLDPAMANRGDVAPRAVRASTGADEVTGPAE